MLKKEDDSLDNRSYVTKKMEERLEKRRRKASVGKLISYVIALIAVIILMVWLRR